MTYVMDSESDDGYVSRHGKPRVYIGCSLTSPDNKGLRERLHRRTDPLGDRLDRVVRHFERLIGNFAALGEQAAVAGFRGAGLDRQNLLERRL